MTISSPIGRCDYTVGCICPMGVELEAVKCMLDSIHGEITSTRGVNNYILGSIGNHNIVLAVLPKIGNNLSAVMATQLSYDFLELRFCFLVGIGGGVPGRADVRLGDVVVSHPSGIFDGVVQYDLGRKLPGERFLVTETLNKPPAVLSAGVRKLRAQHYKLGNQLSTHVLEMVERHPEISEQYSIPNTAVDQLFLSNYPHQGGSDCSECSPTQTVQRPPRQYAEPVIHYGTIGTANLVVKDAETRDQLREDLDILCVEMEAAGIIDIIPSLVIRGICDYADSHKNKQWQPYAASIAAAYMKDLLLTITPEPDVGEAIAIKIIFDGPFQ